MNFFDILIEYDKHLLLFLHSLGAECFDNFWLFITDPFVWIPLIFLLFFLGYKAYGFKRSMLIGLFLLAAGSLSFVIVNIIKNSVKRIRPLNDAPINDAIRVLIDATDYSFLSGHSTVSFVITFISYWSLKKHYKLAFLIFLFPLFFSYSRIYLAAHFPTDILAGILLAYLVALGFNKLIGILILKK